MAGVYGQGRRFELDQALDVAMDQFWQHGYEGTSISTLTKAIGIEPPSLYAAFGNKRRLFNTVITHYLEGPGGWMKHAFSEERSASALIRRLLCGAAVHYTDPAHPGGCLIIAAAMCVTEANKTVADALREHRNHNVAVLVERLANDQDSGDLPSGLDPRAAAEFIAATTQGMSMRARDGATVDQLMSVAHLACLALGVEPQREAGLVPDRA